MTGPLMKFLSASLCAVALAAASPLAAEVTFDAPSGLKSVAFLDGWRMEDGHRMAALRITLQDGWKTYWRAPGGVGLPAQFDWTGSGNLSAVNFRWPKPSVYRDDGSVTIGYKHELILPIELTAKDPYQPIAIHSTVEFGVCAEVCVPASARIDAILMPRAEHGKPEILTALAAEPEPADKAGVSQVKCVVAPVEDGFAITAHFSTRKPFSPTAVTVFEYPHPDVWIEGTHTNDKGASVTVTSVPPCP